MPMLACWYDKARMTLSLAETTPFVVGAKRPLYRYSGPKALLKSVRLYTDLFQAHPYALGADEEGTRGGNFGSARLGFVVNSGNLRLRCATSCSAS